MKTIVTGSLGHIGKPLTEKLVTEGQEVTVISHSPERKQEIEALGATAAIGSLQDAGFLESTFMDVDAAFLMVPPNFSKPDQVAYYRNIAGNYMHAIKQSNIKRAVHLSSYGAHLEKNTGFILGSHHAENILNELSGVTLTHLRAGFFYYNFFGTIDMVKQQGVITENYGREDKLILVHPRDIAEVAAKEIQTPSGKKIRYVVSDERKAGEVVDVLGKAIGKPKLEWRKISDQQLQNNLQAKGMPRHAAAGLAEIGVGIHRGALLEDYEKQDVSVVPHGVKLEEFAEEFTVVYNKR